MKVIFTLFTLLILNVSSQAQVILNEVYCLPGNNRHEFFELYNNSSSPTPLPLDNYTMVTYVEGIGQVTNGFYVMDFPALTVGPKGYFVGAAANPFNCQSLTGVVPNFNWNDVPTLNANNGYLKRWVLGSLVPAAVDGNSFYDEMPVSANLNDFFSKISGGNATYVILIYKNGVLLSTFLGGTGGSTSFPSYLLSMPKLFVDMSGTSPDFVIDFSSYANFPAEFVIPEAGTDNGYIRTRDGFCGTWTKSSSGVNHTPGLVNGGTVIPDGVVSVSAVIVRGGPMTGSVVNFDLVGAPATALPAIIDIYTDNGTTPGSLDASDNYVASTTENSIDDPSRTVTFFPYNANIILVVTTASGCIDKMLFIPNTGVLPVHVTRLWADDANDKNLIRWTVADNEFGKAYDLEKSVDGNNYYVISSLQGTGTRGSGYYQFYDSKPSKATTYRIRVRDVENKISFSPVLSLIPRGGQDEGLTVIGNPVKNNLVLSFSTEENSVQVNIYNVLGMKIESKLLSTVKGQNRILLALQESVGKGQFLAEVSTSSKRKTVRFVKD